MYEKKIITQESKYYPHEHPWLSSMSKNVTVNAKYFLL